MERKIVIVFSMIFLSMTFFSSVSAQEETASHLAIIIIDGCRADYLDLATLPNIKSIIDHGTKYDRAWTGQLVNNTPPGHATIGTGVFPKRHGIVAFWRRNSDTGVGEHLTFLDSVMSGYLGQIVANNNVPTLVGSFKNKYPLAKAAALSSSKPYAAAAIGNYTADWILFAYRLNGVYKPIPIYGHQPPDLIMRDELLNIRGYGGNVYGAAFLHDDWAANAAKLFIVTKRPQILMVNLPLTDEVGHETGGTLCPETMKQVIQNVDTNIRNILQAYRDANIFDKTIFLVTSEHGMIPNTRTIQIPSVTKLATECKTGLFGPPPAIWLTNRAKLQELADKIAVNLGDKLTGVYYKTKDALSGEYQYQPAKSGGERDGVYRYLLSTCVGPYGPDIFMFAPENTLFVNRAFPLANSIGEHPVATWFTQHIPLIISGPGVKKGSISSFPARLVDIAPTLLSLVGVTPNGMDGIVLADCMNSPTEEQINSQKAVEPNLLLWQNQLKSLTETQNTRNQ